MQNQTTRAGQDARHSPRTKKNLLLCVNIKVAMQHDELPTPGKLYFGVLRSKLPSEGNVYGDDYTFTEVAYPLTAFRRNVRLYEGKFVTVTCRHCDGSLRLNFKNVQMDADFNIDSYCFGVANEIREALKSLLGEGDAEE